jgi:hypothetical protein
MRPGCVFTHTVTVTPALLGCTAIGSAQWTVSPPTGLLFTIQGGGSVLLEHFSNVNGTLATTLTVDQTQVPWAILFQQDRAAARPPVVVVR